MKFRHTINSKSVIKKQKEYDFKLSEEQIAKGRSATFDNPFFTRQSDESLCWLMLYMHKCKLRIHMLHSFDCFEEMFE